MANNGFLQSVTAAVWKPNQSENLPLPNEGEKSKENSVDSSNTNDAKGSDDNKSCIQSNPPPHLMISGDNTQISVKEEVRNNNTDANDTVNKPVEGVKQNKPGHVKRVSSLGLQIESVLGRKTGN